LEAADVMPKCAECGREALRDEMFGPADELRCARCADRYRQVFVAPRRPVATTPRPVVTLTVCGLAIAATVANAKPEPFIGLLLPGPKIWEGELWRLLTCVFPHVNFIHLAFDVYVTWRFGSVIESWLGSIRFAGLFLLLALGSSAAEFLSSGVGGVGLSGVAYGLFGLLFALRHDKEFAALEMRPQVIQWLVAWFFLCIVLTYTNIMAVGNVAHGAGAVLGWLVGRALLLRQRVWAMGGIVVLVLALCGTTLYMPWNGRYALFRGNQALTRRNYGSALYWYRGAERTFPDNRDLRDTIISLQRKVDETTPQ
jgi:membrane associated rhomboid family serine protease